MRHGRVHMGTPVVYGGGYESARLLHRVLAGGDDHDTRATTRTGTRTSSAPRPGAHRHSGCVRVTRKRHAVAMRKEGRIGLMVSGSVVHIKTLLWRPRGQWQCISKHSFWRALCGEKEYSADSKKCSDDIEEADNTITMFHSGMLL